jgi:hypothetical protein
MNTHRGRHVDFFEVEGYHPTVKEAFFAGRAGFIPHAPKSEFQSDRFAEINAQGERLSKTGVTVD